MAELPATLGEALAAARGRIPASEARMFLREVAGCTAAQVAAYVNYVSPVKGAKEVLAQTDPELAESPFIFPSEEYIAENNIKGFSALSAEDDADFSAIWQKVMGN